MIDQEENRKNEDQMIEQVGKQEEQRPGDRTRGKIGRKKTE